MKRLVYLLSGFACFALLATAALILLLQYVSAHLPSIDSLQHYQPKQTTRLFDAKGHLVDELFTQRRTVIAFDAVPKQVRQAFLAAEDAAFYDHSGIDYMGLGRAAINELRYVISGTGSRQGASTITQQVARTMLLSRERSYTRKLREMLLTKRIENSLSKDQIFHLYLNQIYFGNGAYGVVEAARTYYGVPVQQLTLGQAAALAAIPKSPNRMNPRADLERLKLRQRYVLRRMIENGYISQQQAQQAMQEPLRVDVARPPYSECCPYYVESVRRWLLQTYGQQQTYEGGLSVYLAMDATTQRQAQLALRKGLHDLDKRQGWRGVLQRFAPEQQQQVWQALQQFKNRAFADNSNQLQQQAWDLQQLAKQFSTNKAAANIPALVKQVSLRDGALLAGWVTDFSTKKSAQVDLGSVVGKLPLKNMQWAINNNKQAANKNSPALLQPGDIVLVRIQKLKPNVVLLLEQIPQVQGSLIAMNPHSGHVKAMVGGYDFAVSQFNRAQQAYRQMGSAIKPFLYGLALQEKQVTPASVISDVPQVFFEDENQWKPRNHTRRFLGDITVRTCMARSVNTCSIQLLQRVGIAGFQDFTKQLQLQTESFPFPSDLTLALGSAVTTPLRFVTAMSVFPSQGLYRPAVLVTRVQDLQGQLLWQADNNSKRVMSPQAAFVTTQLMRQTFRHKTGRLVTRGLQQWELAGKTGTTNRYRTAWFMGFSPTLTAGVYMGVDNNSSLGEGEYGVRAALPVWGHFMQKVLKDLPPQHFHEPLGIVWQRINRKTGKPVSRNDVLDDTDDAATVLEAFIEGTQPEQQTGPAEPLVPLDLLDAG
ncbi:MAG: PBP1A family penicillin-binding protein [Myxococcota bacterium]